MTWCCYLVPGRMMGEPPPKGDPPILLIKPQKPVQYFNEIVVHCTGVAIGKISFVYLASICITRASIALSVSSCGLNVTEV